jgi:hypothetical protein
VLPGFIALSGVSPFVPAVGTWLMSATAGHMELGAPVYALLAALTSGMIVGCVRWLVVDHLLLWTGLRSPPWDLSQLECKLEAFNFVVENNYRYYQFYANATVATVWAYLVNRILKTSVLLGIGTDLGVLFLCAVLLLGARDSLAKYYERSSQLVGPNAEKGETGAVMTNGFHHDGGGSSNPKPTPKPAPKVATKPAESKSGK